MGGRGLWLLAKSRKHRKFEFGEWKKASGVELGAEKDRDEGKLRESIRRYGGTWSAGKTWELGAEKNRCGVCVCLSVPVRPSMQGPIGERRTVLRGRTIEYGKREDFSEELCQGVVGLPVDRLMGDWEC